MSEWSAELRRIPGWWKLYRDPATRQEWSNMAQKRVFKVRTPSSAVDVKLSDHQINYLLDELEGYAALRHPETGCQLSCFERIWELELPASHTTLSSLNAALAILRSETTAHPWDSNGICTALVDPYLHPLVYNRTLVAHPHNRYLRTLPSPTGGDIYTVSPNLAFLPAEVTISTTGAVSFSSYINNLHPQKHADIYKQLETLLGTSFIPLFERVLTDLHRNNPLPQRIPGPCRYTVWDEPDEPEYSDDEAGWVAYEREMRHWVMNRPIHLPDVPPNGYTGGLAARKHTVSLGGKNVQVVVGIEDMRLEPGGPSYPGSPWHVEGMRNERIVACGELYTAVENITPPALEFRMAVTYPRGFTAGDTGATARTWGLRDSDACHQYIGARALTPGLAIAFPNLYQHRLSPFALVDPSLSGRLGVLRFWLVDPEIWPVVSTGVVAPQQMGWIREAVGESLGQWLPVELVEQVMSEVEGLMGKEEAEEYKMALRVCARISTLIRWFPSVD
ncbi:hypothetical protein DXG03_000741 [Asterophora parasitica]|uniref:DUF4246 domain-containing protein n=1 Tax=Asterophora parasitica TaxID=117018 RepID=A0A9P7KC47_9AGAR|nr:hypothetical protein DXG03_000741 [Asterophora parasitica]